MTEVDVQQKDLLLAEALPWCLRKTKQENCRKNRHKTRTLQVQPSWKWTLIALAPFESQNMLPTVKINHSFLNEAMSPIINC